MKGDFPSFMNGILNNPREPPVKSVRLTSSKYIICPKEIVTSERKNAFNLNEGIATNNPAMTLRKTLQIIAIGIGTPKRVVKSADVYAPMAEKPACPRDIWPAKPVRNTSPDASIIFNSALFVTNKS